MRKDLRAATSKPVRDSLKTSIHKHISRQEHFKGIPGLQIIRGIDEESLIYASKFDYCLKSYNKVNLITRLPERVSIETGKAIPDTVRIRENKKSETHEFTILFFQSSVKNEKGFLCDSLVVKESNLKGYRDITFYELLVTKEIDLPSEIFYHWGPGLFDGAVLYAKQYSERDLKTFYITELVEVRQNIQKQFDRVRKNMLKHSS